MDYCWIFRLRTPCSCEDHLLANSVADTNRFTEHDSYAVEHAINESVNEFCIDVVTDANPEQHNFAKRDTDAFCDTISNNDCVAHAISISQFYCYAYWNANAIRDTKFKPDTYSFCNSKFVKHSFTDCFHDGLSNALCVANVIPKSDTKSNPVTEYYRQPKPTCFLQYWGKW